MTTDLRVLTVAIVVAGVLLASSCDDPQPSAARAPVLSDPAWNEPGIAYSGYRRGQDPSAGVRPSREQIAEDLRILERTWSLIRIYGSDRYGEDVLEVIRGEGFDLEVMLGIWLAKEPGAEERNATEIERGIRLANEYDDIVVAVNVGNETLIGWTEHPVPEERVLGYVREVKAAVPQPVTVADNYVWWRDDGAALAREVDFITLHSYPLWERRDIDVALSYTIENVEQVRAAHPGKPLVIGEAGWATYTVGNLHVPRGGDEVKQQRYYRELTSWVRENDVGLFWFGAFDEPWKGAGTEGHWGLFTEDRKAKLAMQDRYPDLAPDGPTSPSYPETIAPEGPPPEVVLRSSFAREISDANVNPMGPGLAASEIVEVTDAEGGTALALDFSGEGWAGAYVWLGGYDARDAQAVALRAKLPDSVARFELKIEAPEMTARAVDLLAHETERDGAGWRTFRVPLDAFDGIDRSRIDIVGVWSPENASGALAACEIVVDDLRFE